MHKFIHSEEEIRKFVNIMSPLKSDESYFVSMSARNKYLTEEERRHYDLGRTEMFARELIKQSKRANVEIEDSYLRVLKSMQVSEGGYTSRSGITLPNKCLVVYANINPSSGIKALKMFYQEMNDALFDLRTNSEAPYTFNNLDTRLMNCYQKSKGTRTLIDIDFDIPFQGFDILEKFIKVINEKDIAHYVVKTKSGYHVLLKKEDIKFNYNILIKEAHEEAQKRFGAEHVEVMVNKNEMIPIPGTIQAGYEVHFLKGL